jgi:ribonuclease D
MLLSGVRWDELPEQVVTRSDELTACCEHLAATRLFGFDTEFVGEDSYHPRLCLVQVATPERLYLIDPLAEDIGPLDAFWKLVVDPANEVIVHAGREEVRLCRLWTGQTPASLFDLQPAAGLTGMVYPLGYGTLVNQLHGVSMSKGETLTEWRSRPLTKAQVRYAFDDVRFLLPVWDRLRTMLDRMGRLDWAKEEFGRLATLAVPEDTVQEKWRKLRGLGSLNRRQLAAVRELYAWREATAARINRPSRTIVRDDLLVEIAKRNPAKERDLHVLRGLPKRDLPAILRVVEEVWTLPQEQLPRVIDREQDVPQVNLVGAILTAVLADLCVRRRLAANMVASGADIRALVKARFQNQPLPADSLLTQGWRAAHVLPDLLAVLEGRRGVRVGNLRAEAPLDFVDQAPLDGVQGTSAT